MNRDLLISWRPLGADDIEVQATVGELRERIEDEERDLEFADEQETEAIIGVIELFESVLMEAELTLMAQTPQAQFLHFNPVGEAS